MKLRSEIGGKVERGLAEVGYLRRILRVELKDRKGMFGVWIFTYVSIGGGGCDFWNK